MPKYMVVFSVAGGQPGAHDAIAQATVASDWYQFVLCLDDVARRVPGGCYTGRFSDLANAKVSFDELMTAAERALGRAIRLSNAALVEYRTGLFKSDHLLARDR